MILLKTALQKTRFQQQQKANTETHETQKTEHRRREAKAYLAYMNGNNDNE